MRILSDVAEAGKHKREEKKTIWEQYRKILDPILKTPRTLNYLI
jgi:hypothetical protein